MSAFTALYATLSADASLLALLPGGFYDGLAVKDITRQATPDAYDEYGEVIPCAIVKPETITPFGPHRDSARLYVAIWFYEQNNHTAIDAARERVYALLHRQQIATDAGIYEVTHATDILGAEVQELSAAMIMSRYVLTVQR